MYVVCCRHEICRCSFFCDVTENLDLVLTKTKISMFLGIILLTQKYFFNFFADTSLFFLSGHLSCKIYQEVNCRRFESVEK